MRATQRLILVAISVSATVAMLAASAAATVNVQVVSTDALTNAKSEHQTEVEPDTFAVGSTIVSAFQVGRIYNGGAGAIGWATSSDGGTSWFRLRRSTRRRNVFSSRARRVQTRTSPGSGFPTASSTISTRPYPT